jgi:hypothetical protein
MSTIPSTLAPVITSYTPEKQFPSFSSIINEYYNPVTYANAGNNTLLASDVIGGLISHTAAGAQTDTLPTAALMVQAIEGARGAIAGSSNVGIAGSGIRFFVRASGAGAITIAPGLGGTLVGSGAIATVSVKEFLLVVTSRGDINYVGATYTIYSLGASTY